MLGWEVFVYRRRSTDPGDGLVVARWMTGVFGLKWIDELVGVQKAVDLGGNGYPCRYSMSASTLLSVIGKGLPSHDSPPVIGQDYVLPAGWSGKVEVNVAALSECDPGEELVIEAWDQS